MSTLLHTLSRHKIFLLVLGAGIGLRLWNIGWSLPDVYEEATPFLKSWQMWNWGNQGFDFNPHFFNYPALTFYIHFIAQCIHYGFGSVIGWYNGLDSFLSAYTANQTPFIITARLTTMAFDWGTLVVSYIFVRRIIASFELEKTQTEVSPVYSLSRDAAIATAFLLAVNPIMIKHSHVIIVDTPLTFFVTLSLYLIYRIYENPSKLLMFVTGLTIGFAAATKYTGAILVPVAIGVFIAGNFTTKRQSLRDLAIRAVTLVLTSTIVFFLLNPYILLDASEFLKDFSFEQEHMATGHLGVDASTNGFAYYLFTVLPDNLGWAITVSVFMGVMLIGYQSSLRNRLILMFPVLYLVIIATWNMRVERYMLPIIPISVAFGVIGIVYLSHRCILFLSRTKVSNAFRPSTLHAILGTLVIVLLGLVPLQKTLRYQTELSLPDTRVLATKWIIQHLPERSVIATGPFGIRIPTHYKELQIPFSPTGTENFSAFYQTRWFEDFDLLIASDYDYGRFILDSLRYAGLLQYYDSLRTHWKLLYELKPNEHQKGPTFWFYAYGKLAADTFDIGLFQRLSLLDDSSTVPSFTEELASQLYLKRKFSKSVQLMKFTLRYNPTSTKYLKELAFTLYLQQNYPEALSYATKALTEKPDVAELLALQGSCLFRLHYRDEAERRLRDALSLNKRLDIPYLELEMLYRTEGNIEKQREILQQYLSVTPPGSPLAGHIRNRLATLPQQ